MIIKEAIKSSFSSVSSVSVFFFDDLRQQRITNAHLNAKRAEKLKLPCAEKFEELQRPRQKSNRA
jgi:hypothetical protein